MRLYKKNNLLFSLLFLLLQLSISSSFANMPPPKYYSKTYFVFKNINKYPSCIFYVRNEINKKVKRLKEEDIVAIAKNTKQHCIEVWCKNITSQQYSDTIRLCSKSVRYTQNDVNYRSEIELELTGNVLNYTQTTFEEEQKNYSPIFTIDTNHSETNMYVILSFSALLLFTIFYFYQSRKINRYV